MKYSLADYIVSIEPNDSSIRNALGNITIGRDGLANGVEQASISYKDSLFDTQSYATGAWVHNKNLSRVGTITISLCQVDTITDRLTKLCKMYYSISDYSGVTINVSKRDGTKVASCVDCYPVKISDRQFQENAQNNEWQFTCGQIEMF